MLKYAGYPNGNYSGQFMTEINPEIIFKVREKFAHIDHCVQQGERIFFENAGGALTLKKVVACSEHYAAIPDNQGRDNLGSKELVRVIMQAKEDMRAFMNAHGGQFFVGESGTELLFRLISTACLGCDSGGTVVGSTLEHPATKSACSRWSKISGQTHLLIEHDNATGLVDSSAYAHAVRPDTCVATIIHTSPVTGMGVDLASIVAEIRAVSPECIIIVDGIQHAAHGSINLASYDIDGYVISPYKVFSRHGYGVAWISDRLSALPHNALLDGPKDNWELGTRDTGSYATFSEVVNYFDWLGTEVSNATSRRDKFLAAGHAIHKQEHALTEAMLHGIGNLVGLATMSGVHILGGANNPAREGLVSFWVDGRESTNVVKHLNEHRIRTHVRKADHYSGAILTPLGLESCVRVSLCHYNTLDEVTRFLIAMSELTE